MGPWNDSQRLQEVIDRGIDLHAQSDLSSNPISSLKSRSLFLQVDTYNPHLYLKFLSTLVLRNFLVIHSHTFFGRGVRSVEKKYLCLRLYDLVIKIIRSISSFRSFINVNGFLIGYLGLYSDSLRRYPLLFMMLKKYFKYFSLYT